MATDQWQMSKTSRYRSLFGWHC